LAGDGQPTNTDPQDDAQQALACFGLQPDQPIGPSAPPKVCEIWPEHVQAMELFSACQSQWQPQMGAMGGVWWRGAQWVNVAQAMGLMRVPKKAQPELWQQYRIMEAEAMTILQARADAAASQK